MVRNPLPIADPIAVVYKQGRRTTSPSSWDPIPCRDTSPAECALVVQSRAPAPGGDGVRAGCPAAAQTCRDRPCQCPSPAEHTATEPGTGETPCCRAALSGRSATSLGSAAPAETPGVTSSCCGTLPSGCETPCPCGTVPGRGAGFAAALPSPATPTGDTTHPRDDAVAAAAAETARRCSFPFDLSGCTHSCQHLRKPPDSSCCTKTGKARSQRCWAVAGLLCRHHPGERHRDQGPARPRTAPLPLWPRFQFTGCCC